jgi:hypothetical protein
VRTVALVRERDVAVSVPCVAAPARLELCRRSRLAQAADEVAKRRKLRGPFRSAATAGQLLVQISEPFARMLSGVALGPGRELARQALSTSPGSQDFDDE